MQWEGRLGGGGGGGVATGHGLPQAPAHAVKARLRQLLKLAEALNNAHLNTSTDSSGSVAPETIAQRLIKN